MTSSGPILVPGTPPPGNSFVLPEHKVVYITVTKVACTSLRWMVADIAGEDRESFYPAIGAQQTRLMTIHGSRGAWKKTPQLGALTREQREEISTDNGWFIFCVVRDPYSRLWSAWQSKFLVRHQHYVDLYQDEPWFPRVPEKASDVVEDYRTFVLARPWTTHEQLKQDWHFRPQVASVRPEKLNYTKIYDLTEMSALFRDLREHLELVGRPQELYVPRANETPLPMTAEALEGGVAEAVEDAYAPDFERLGGGRWTRESVKVAPDGWSQDAIRHVAYHTVANERIGDLRTVARDYRQQVLQLERVNAQQAEELAALKSPRQFLVRAVKKVRRTIGHG